MQSPEFKIGDSVVLMPSSIGKYDERPRRGIVVTIWNGKPSAIQPGVPFMDVQFDDGELRTGCLNRLGRFHYAPLIIAPTTTFAR